MKPVYSGTENTNQQINKCEFCPDIICYCLYIDKHWEISKKKSLFCMTPLFSVPYVELLISLSIYLSCNIWQSEILRRNLVLQSFHWKAMIGFDLGLWKTTYFVLLVLALKNLNYWLPTSSTFSFKNYTMDYKLYIGFTVRSCCVSQLTVVLASL